MSYNDKYNVTPSSDFDKSPPLSIPIHESSHKYADVKVGGLVS